jgi:transposase
MRCPICGAVAYEIYCDGCGGDGGWYEEDDLGEYWEDCERCHGVGFIDGEYECSECGHVFQA